LIFLAVFFLWNVTWLTQVYVMHGFVVFSWRPPSAKIRTSLWTQWHLFSFCHSSIALYFVLRRVSIICFIGLGIFAYGIAFISWFRCLIHQRFKWFKTQTTSTLLAYVKHIKYTTKNMGKEDSKVSGMLLSLLNITKCKWVMTLLKSENRFNKVGFHSRFYIRDLQSVCKELRCNPHATLSTSNQYSTSQMKIYSKETVQHVTASLDECCRFL
jgi:beta-carotene 3-hydroxylase